MATTSDSASLPQASDEHSLEGLPSQTQDGSATPDAMELARVSSEDELISRACTVTDDLTNPSTRTSSALQHSGSPAWRDEGATVVAAQTGAGDDVANSAEMPSPLEEEPSQQLSSEDVIELNKFNEGKSRIEEFLQILDQRPKLEPLADCKEAGNRPSDEIWPDLDARIAETESWIDEVERIEEEATAWNAADVERLRRVSKEASERHMSPQDADLVELALETLVALDKLLHLCGFRRDQLELLRARLEWESHRRHCWDVYRTLLADVDEFVTARARWTTEVYLHGVGRNPDSNASSFDSDRLSPETPLRSPLRERSSASRQRVSARLDADSQKLAHRINAFAKATGECGDVLDGVMECHKLPDEFLDEQDRLENLTSSMAARSELLDQLVRQWHQSDSAYSTLQTLAADAQRTTAKLRDEEQGVPDSQRAQDFSGQIASFCQRLETLIGPEQASSVNLATPLGAQPSLRRHLRPVQPQEQIYADQAEHTRALEDALSLEMHKTVTAVREAKSALERHFRALRALQLIQRLVASLDSLTNQCRAVAEQATSGFEVESPSTGADTSAQRSLANPGSKPDLTLLEALKAPAHDVYLSRLPGLRPTLAGLVVKGADLRKEIDAATLEAVKAGLIPSAFRRQLDKSLANFEQVKRDTDAAIEDGSEVVVMLKQLRTADQLIDAVQKNAAALLQRVNEDCIKVAEAYPWRSVNSTDALRDLRASLQVARERMTETRQARAASERALQLAAGLAKANEASSIQRHLVDSSFEADRRVSQAEAALRWLEVSLDQLGAVVDLRSTFEEATAQGHQVAELISQHAGQSVATLASSVATFSQSVWTKSARRSKNVTMP
ncbi:hypothetical protein IE81DRAFT_54242 [Ceraceosorus guamensis]|uniref:Uncharacterized protein n=1 Tax=Ceraceosorus guamensis TaxID=1522189 RepID=A0A316W8F6_9BASI|nr:hypothetical protein IE81DRAFT_54242 [Ceraceosorus guamensis]PWN43965.1 hypothetical protein IE81DRAFT_54242 [Ceraceosorus guamensis]